MTNRAAKFLEQWVSQHMTPLSYDEDDTEAKGSARMCLADAERKGISQTELKDAAGGALEAFMAREIRTAVDEEARRLAEKGP